MPTEITVAITTVGLNEGEAPETHKDNIVRGALADEDLFPYALDAVTHRLENRFRRGLNYCEGHRTEWMVRAEMTTLDNNEDFALALEDRYSFDAGTVTVNTFGAGTNQAEKVEAIVPDYLYETYEWNSVDNIMTDPDTYSHYEIDNATDEIVIYSNVGETDRIPLPAQTDITFIIGWEHSDEPGLQHTAAFIVDNSNGDQFFVIPYHDDSFFPIVPLRRDKENINEDTTPSAEGDPPTDYEVASRIGDLIKIDIDQMVSSIEESPSIDDIDDVYVTFLADLYSENQGTIKYLMAFFRDFQDFINENSSGDGAFGAFTNQFKFNSGEFSYSIGFEAVDVRIEADTNAVEDVGTYTREIAENFTMFYRFHFSETETEVIEVTPYGVGFVQLHPGEYKTSKNKVDSDPDKQKGMFIPISIDIAREHLGIWERDQLFFDGFKLYINAIHKEDLEWYETGLFKIFIAIVAIVVSLGTLGPAFGAALAAGATATIAFVIKLIVVQIIAKYVTEWIYENVEDPVIAQILSFAFTFAIGEISGLTDFGSMTNVDKLLFSVTQLSDVATSYVEFQMEELYEEFGEYEKAMEEQMKLIEDAQDLLGGIDGLAEFMAFVDGGSTSYGFEPSGKYYTRTLMANPGVLSLSAIDSYFDVVTSLPEGV